MCSSAIYERCRAIGDRNCAEHAIVLNDSVVAFDRSQQVSHLALGPLGVQRGIDVPVAGLVDPFAGTLTIRSPILDGTWHRKHVLVRKAQLDDCADTTSTVWT